MSLDALDIKHIPKTLPHVFDLKPLAKHFNKNPLSAGACKLIDLPGDQFIPTEDEINVIAAAMWVMSVKYDNMPVGERPDTRDNLRKWITRHRAEAVSKLIVKVEPPFHAQTVDIFFKDVATMLDELLSKTLPQPPPPAEKGKEPTGKPEAKGPK
ncbi:hypothetical protein IAT38_006729 [Cryptococcus sp. DSM 104549]